MGGCVAAGVARLVAGLGWWKLRAVREWTDLNPMQARKARPLSNSGAQRVTTVEVIGAVGRENRHGRVEPPGEQQAEEVSGGLIRPVHILNDDKQRC